MDLQVSTTRQNAYMILSAGFLKWCEILSECDTQNLVVSIHVYQEKSAHCNFHISAEYQYFVINNYIIFRFAGKKM